METKKCTKCGEVKELGEFHKDRRSRDGRQGRCRLCVNQCSKQHYQANKEKVKQRSKQHYQANKEKIKQHKKQYLEKNKEKIKQYDKQYKQEHKEEIKQYNQEHKEKIKQRRKNRYHSDPLYRMVHSYRTAVRRAFDATKQNKNCKSFDLLGTTKERFYEYIDQQLQPGMTWDNMGEWHLDHIKPINLATNEQEAIELSHYTNFRPLWAEDNISRPSDGSDLTSPWPRKQ